MKEKLISQYEILVERARTTRLNLSDAKSEHEIAKHKIRQAFNEKKLEGLKMTEEAIRTESVVGSEATLRQTELLAAELANLEMEIELVQYKLDVELFNKE